MRAGQAPEVVARPPGQEEAKEGAAARLALFLAAALDDVDGLRRALAEGADPKADVAGAREARSRHVLEGCEGMTALMVAARQGSFGSMAVLLPLSDPSARSLPGRGRDGSMAGPFGYTALMLAAYNGSMRGVEMLLMSSDLEAQNSRGMTALDIAKGAKRPDMAKLIEDWAAASAEAKALESAAPSGHGGLPARRPAL